MGELLSIKELDERNKQIKEEFRGIIDEIKLAIQSLKATDEGFEKIDEYYKEGVKVALENDVELGIVGSYINFLIENNEKEEALRYAKKLEAKYTLLDINDAEKWANLYTTYAILHKDKDINLAKEYMSKAVDLYNKR